MLAEQWSCKSAAEDKYQTQTGFRSSPEILKHNIFPLTQPFEVTVFSKTKGLPCRAHLTPLSGLSRGKWGWGTASPRQGGSCCEQPTSAGDTQLLCTPPQKAAACIFRYFLVAGHVWSIKLNSESSSAISCPALGHTPEPQEHFPSGFCYSQALHRKQKWFHPPPSPWAWLLLHPKICIGQLGCIPYQLHRGQEVWGVCDQPLLIALQIWVSHRNKRETGKNRKGEVVKAFLCDANAVMSELETTDTSAKMNGIPAGSSWSHGLCILRCFLDTSNSQL